MDYYCKYCRQLTKVNYENCDYAQYQCDNHNIEVYFEFSTYHKGNIRTTLANKLYEIVFCDDDKYYFLISKYAGTHYKILKDNNLTPENIDQKLKLYLTFM